MQFDLPWIARGGSKHFLPGASSGNNFERGEKPMYELDQSLDRANIKVVGVGGAGGNALNTMIAYELQGVDFIAANTDAQALRASRAPVKLQLGPTLTKGLGAGSNPEVGRQAAIEERDRIMEMLEGSDMVFVTAGMGGGTGTGAAPVIAQLAREVKALTVGVVTRPFTLEGKQRRSFADEGLRHLRNSVDSLIVIPNDRLLQFGGNKMTFKESFQLADNVLFQAVRGISDIIQVPGQINVDFADVRAVMTDQGLALMGVGEATGEHRAREAAEAAISSPLLDNVDIKGARGVLLNITAPSTLGMDEFQTIIETVQEEAHEDVLFKYGIVFDEGLQDRVRCTVIATGFDDPQSMRVDIRAPQPLRATGTTGRASWGGSTQTGGSMGSAGAASPSRPVLGGDRDLPAHKRQERDLQLPEPVRHEALGKTGDDGWDEYDIPAFLRKQRD